MAKVRFNEQRGWWLIDYFDAHGVRQQRKGGRTRSQAEAALRKALDEVHEQKVYGTEATKAIAFDAFCKDYLEYADKNKRASSAERDGYIVENLKKTFGNRPLLSIRAKDVQKYKDSRTGSEEDQVAPATVNRELAVLKNIFTKAIEWGYAKENPVKKVKLHKLNNGVIRFLSQAERTQLLANSPRKVRSVVEFAIMTGMRKSEIFGLHWAHVDLERCDIHVVDSKNHEGRHIPINGPLHDLLTDLQKEVKLSDPRVFWDTENFRKLWEKAVKDAGVLNFRFHDLRHTFASYSVMSGMDLKTLQELLGHKTLAMTMRYAHLSQTHKAAAMKQLATYVKDDDEQKKAAQ